MWGNSVEDQPPTFVSFTPSILSPRHQHLFTKFIRDIALYIKNIELAVELPRPYTVDAAPLKDKGRGIVFGPLNLKVWLHASFLWVLFSLSIIWLSHKSLQSEMKGYDNFPQTFKSIELYESNIQELFSLNLKMPMYGLMFANLNSTFFQYCSFLWSN